VKQIKAKGFSQEELLVWGLEQQAEVEKANCRLQEARRANLKEKFDEDTSSCEEDKGTDK
jgi:hypothetical protein